MRRTERMEGFVSEIRKWFICHKRTLPWRDLDVEDETERAYRILVSEIMLQQTQVERVKVIYKRFLEQFPTIENLSNASNREVILAWRGMGYNSRALRLRDAAKTIVKDFDSVFPKEMDELTSIKGIGEYTAAAIRNFAFNLPTPCIDTNIRRILHRTFVGPENPDGTWKKNDAYLLKIAEETLTLALQSNVESRKSCDTRLSTFDKHRTTADWHAALMDFGSLVCTKTHPKWNICPLTKRGLMKAAYKVKVDKRKKKEEPGRFVGSKFIPNRIFRGKIVEELRDEEGGLPLAEIGRRICIDWSPDEHEVWLTGLIENLKRDHLLKKQRGRFMLVD